MRIFPLFFSCIFFCFVALSTVSASIQLAGQWQLRLDPDDDGLREDWQDRNWDGENVWLPGALQNQGFGLPVTAETEWTGSIVDESYYTEEAYAPYRRPDNVKVPFFLQPPTHYVGAAWYQREIHIPEAWDGRRIILSLERPHWGTQIWVDGRSAGTGDSLSTPHVFDLSEVARPGTTQTLTLRVDNRLLYAIGVNSHSVSDQTQTNWNGVVGSMTLASTQPVWIENIKIVPDPANQQARVTVRIGDATGRLAWGTLELSAESYNTARPHRVEPVTFETQWSEAGDNTYVTECVLEMGEDVRLWDEFDPALYRLRVRFRPEADLPEREQTVTFGMRDFSTSGTRFTINGRPTFLRGALDCAVFPLTGYPPTDVEHWRRIYETCKEYGINHIRFHSWCPPEAAFQAADEVGIYLQPEAASWANQGSSIGRGEPVDDWLIREGERIVEEYGHHPSFVLFAYGNEPAGPGRGGRFLDRWLAHFKQLDPQRVHTGAAGWPIIEANEFHVDSAARLHQWGDGLDDRLNSQPPSTSPDYRDIIDQYDVPYISHEIGQWCVYPNFDEMTKYTGALKPKNFEIFQDRLAENHMGDQAEAFLHASGRLQAEMYKEEIEASLRTPGLAGFQLLGLQDFSGQGTALVGVVDAFWEPKPYVTAEEYRQFNSPTVPLARLDRRVFVAGETLTSTLEVAHYGPANLGERGLSWRLLDESEGVLRRGGLEGVDFPTGGLITAGEIEASLEGVDAPQRLTLEVAIDGTDTHNAWNLWIMERDPGPAGDDDLLIADTIDDALRSHLSAGGAAWLQLPSDGIDVKSQIGFTPVFWNTAWTGGQEPHTLGLLIDAEHSALAGFPTATHSDWQWWDPVTHSQAMVLDGLPPELRPIVQPIDTWFEARRLGLVFEARVGEGRLLVSSIDFDGDLDQRPSSRQLHASLENYLRSDAFAPDVPIELNAVQGLLREAAQQND